MNSLFSYNVDQVKEKSIEGEMIKWMNENEEWYEQSKPKSKTRRIGPVEKKEVKEERNHGRDKILSLAHRST